MANAVAVDAKTISTILTRLDKLVRDVEAIKTRVFEKQPPYGSDMWWDKEMKEAEEAFRKGKGIKFNSAKEAIKWLNS
mgnify:CR=1 FL=1